MGVFQDIQKQGKKLEKSIFSSERNKELRHKARTYITDKAKEYGVDKPGGDVKRFTDWGKDVSDKATYHAFGGDYYTKDRSGSSGSGDDSEGASRQTAVRKGMLADQGDDPNRRNLAANKGRPGTLLTPGLRSKKLTA